jgi:hypothetical protein
VKFVASLTFANAAESQRRLREVARRERPVRRKPRGRFE